MTESGSGRVRAALLAAGAVALIAVSLAAEAASGISNDVYWLLHAAGRVLDGAVLYRDVVDTNPPLSVWIYLPAAAVARLTGLEPMLLVRAGMTLLAVVVLLATDRVWRRAGTTPGARTLLAGVGIIATLTLPLAAFGQREHLVFLVSLPYVAGAVARASNAGLSRPTRIVTGVLLGIAIALKPFYGVLWIALELLVVAVRPGRRLRVEAESAAVLAVGCAYLLLAATVAGDFLRVLPLLLELYPRYAPEPLDTLIWRYPFVWFAAAALLVGSASLRAAPAPLTMVLTIATAAHLVAALVQAKGYPYHFYPAAGAALILLGAVVGRLRGAARLPRLAGTVALALPVSYLLAAALRLALGPPPIERRALAQLQAAAGPLKGRSIAALSPKTGLAMWLAAYGGADWVMRHACLWVPVTVYDGQRLDQAGAWMHPPDRMPAAERWFFDGIVEDLTLRPPDVLVVQLPQDSPDDVRRGIDWIRYFGQDARFRDLLKAYDEVGRAEGYAIFRRAGRTET